MPRYKFIAVASLALILSAVVASRTAATTSLPPAFSSVYTNLNTECKDAFKSVGDGQDMPLKCKGYGGYYVYIYYSAWASQININMNRDKDVSISLAMQSLNYSDEKGRKIEWRLANGKPFAVIMRVSNYKENNDGGNPFEEQLKTGESLIIKGLKGFEQIDLTLDAKTPNANAKAREMADKAYTEHVAG